MCFLSTVDLLILLDLFVRYSGLGLLEHLSSFCGPVLKSTYFCPLLCWVTFFSSRLHWLASDDVSHSIMLMDGCDDILTSVVL